MAKVYLIDKRDYSVHYAGTYLSGKHGELILQGVTDYIHRHKIGRDTIETLNENQFNNLKKSVNGLKC